MKKPILFLMLSALLCSSCKSNTQQTVVELQETESAIETSEEPETTSTHSSHVLVGEILPEGIASQQVYFKKMTVKARDNQHYSLYLSRINSHYQPNGSATVLINTPTGEPFYLKGEFSDDGKEVTFIDYINDQKIQLTGTYISSEHFRLNIDQVLGTNLGTLDFKEVKSNYQLQPSYYYKAEAYTSLDEAYEGSVYKNFTSSLIINNINFGKGFPAELNTLISTTILKNNYHFTKEFNDFDTLFSFIAPDLNTVDVVVQPMYFSDELLCVGIEYISYAMGASHGQYSTNFFNYDLVKQKEIKLTNLFSTSTLEKITELGSDKFKTKYNRSSADVDNFELPNNFALLQNGILFLFQPYEKGSFAQGAMNFFIPYTELPGGVKANQELLRLIEN